MTKSFRQTSTRKTPQRSREHQHDEYGKEKPGITGCKDCDNVQYRKRWYSTLNDIKDKVKELKPRVSRTDRCPACTMIKNKLFEGELVIEGVPKESREELVNLINNFGAQAINKDPQDRIITIKKIAGGFRVTTTENQMATRLAKKITSTFKTMKATFSHSREPYEVSRVKVSFA